MGLFSIFRKNKTKEVKPEIKTQKKMEIIELSRYIENDADKFIFEILGNNTHDANNNIANTTMMVISNGCKLNPNRFKLNIEDYNDDSFGAICLYCNLLTLLNVKIEKYPNRNGIISEIIMILELYLNSEIGKMQFIENLWEMQKVVGISSNFYDALIDYCIKNREYIKIKLT